MSMEGRMRQIERSLGKEGEPQPMPMIIYTRRPDLDDGRSFTDEDYDVGPEITAERVRRAWPHGLLASTVTPQDVDAWLSGRLEEALRGIGHRPALVDAMGSPRQR